MRAKQEPPGEVVENRSSDIRTNSGGILKECLGEYRHFELSFALIRVPKYCDVIVRRWQAYTGKAATFEGIDLTFEDFEGARASFPASRGVTPLPPAGPAKELPQ
jgi:hypothetical protein